MQDSSRHHLINSSEKISTFLQARFKDEILNHLVALLSSVNIRSNTVLHLNASIESDGDASKSPIPLESTDLVSKYFQIDLTGLGLISAPQASPEQITPCDDSSCVQSPEPKKRKRVQDEDSQYQDISTSPKAELRRQHGGLRPARQNISSPAEDDEDTRRQIRAAKRFPKRVKVQPPGFFTAKEASLNRFIDNVWRQIHEGVDIELPVLPDQVSSTASPGDTSGTVSDPEPGPVPNLSSSTDMVSINGSASAVDRETFKRGNMLCLNVCQASRTARSVEVIVQARWIELLDAYVDHLSAENPSLSKTRHRMTAVAEACQIFNWTEKQLRNKETIWRGYKDIKDAGGWAMLVFSGMGLYRLCKYRIDFSKDKLKHLSNLRRRVELAADTLHPTWRQLLAIVGGETQRRFTGHPHDWVVRVDGREPLPLRDTYPTGSISPVFEHRQDCIVEPTKWPHGDPRWVPPATVSDCVSGAEICHNCGQVQSANPRHNRCECFRNLFGSTRGPCPVQIFRTLNGRNNGLQALVAFERGTAIGEFVGIVTRDITGCDVMSSSTGAETYQIWQGEQGNFTRFVNHSCNPNAQFERFSWLSTQRIILVSKGIDAGSEITVDYSASYWKGLDKKCLCGEPCCRYRGVGGVEVMRRILR